jgi:hypothetical protein
LKRKLVLAAAAFALLYLIGVISTGLGWNPLGASWNFENSGQFGDSFGPLGALMSAIAAVSALLAYWSQREQLEELRTSERVNNSRMDLRDFEETFFRLLSLFREVVNAVEHKYYDRGEDFERKGSYAFYSMINMWTRERQINKSEVAGNFQQMYNRHQGSMGHYFRLFYHILKFIDESAIENKNRYARFLRALLSRSEILLIGLNCAHGGGKEKLKPLVEKYAILHNISATEARRLYLISEFSQAAFGDRSLESELEHSD